MALRACYAVSVMSGTKTAYAVRMSGTKQRTIRFVYAPTHALRGVRSRVLSPYARAMRCPAYGAMRYPVLRYAAICCTICGTEIAYGAMRYA
eukprot:965434-Rhodomonas_salina.1